MSIGNSLVIKIVVISFVLLFSNSLLYSQGRSNEQRKPTMKYKYGKKFALKIREEVRFADSLSIVLTSFSHKRPFTGGPTKATAYLTLSRGSVSENIELSVHGTEGQDDSGHYDSLQWEEYTFQLMSFDYDKSIELIISKKK